jgi:hypothetical protein
VISFFDPDRNPPPAMRPDESPVVIDQKFPLLGRKYPLSQVYRQDRHRISNDSRLLESRIILAITVTRGNEIGSTWNPG